MENEKRYRAQIAREDHYWGEFETDANRYGVPWWCDMRRATKLTKVILGWMYDPKIERILRGNYKAYLIELASSVKGNALDLGCGAGWLSLELARRGMHVDGLEISATRLSIAREYLRNNICKEGFGSIHYQLEDINKISLQKNKYVSVVSWDTLHHIPEIERVVREIHASLGPQGYFILYDHIGLHKKNEALLHIARIPYAILSRIRRMFKAASASEEGNPVCDSPGRDMRSPFEDVTQMEMVDAIKMLFTIETLKTQLCFLGALANELISLPDTLKYPLLRLLKFIDDTLIRMHIAQGEYVFVIARKKGSGK